MRLCNLPMSEANGWFSWCENERWMGPGGLGGGPGWCFKRMFEIPGISHKTIIYEIRDWGIWILRVYPRFEGRLTTGAPKPTKFLPPWRSHNTVEVCSPCSPCSAHPLPWVKSLGCDPCKVIREDCILRRKGHVLQVGWQGCWYFWKMRMWKLCFVVLFFDGMPWRILWHVITLMTAIISVVM